MSVIKEVTLAQVQSVVVVPPVWSCRHSKLVKREKISDGKTVHLVFYCS